MSYSDLLARQDKELERLNQEYYADQAKLKELQRGHYDPKRFDGEFDRLRGAFEREVGALHSRFEQERKVYLKEPDTPSPELTPASGSDISASQDKANELLKQFRQPAAPENKNQPVESQSPKPTQSSRQDIPSDELEKLKHEARQRREVWQQRRRGGHKR